MSNWAIFGIVVAVIVAIVLLIVVLRLVRRKVREEKEAKQRAIARAQAKRAESEPSKGTEDLSDFPYYNWFSTEKAKKTFYACTSALAYKREAECPDISAVREGIQKVVSEGYDAKFSGVNYERNKQWIRGLGSCSDIPTEFFYMFLYSSPIRKAKLCERTFTSDFVFYELCRTLCIMAEREEIDENGEPVSTGYSLDYYQLVSVAHNPLLKFANEFEGFSSDEFAEDNDLMSAWCEALYFIGEFVWHHGDWDVLNRNQWLLNRDSYFTSLGTAKTKIGFINFALSKVTTDEEKQYFDRRLEQERKAKLVEQPVQ